MALTPAMSCKELCGRDKPCGNVFCSLHSKYRGPIRKKQKKTPKKTLFKGFIPRGQRVWRFDEKGEPM